MEDYKKKTGYIPDADPRMQRRRAEAQGVHNRRVASNDLKDFENSIRHLSPMRRGAMTAAYKKDIYDRETSRMEALKSKGSSGGKDTVSKRMEAMTKGTTEGRKGMESADTSWLEGLGKEYDIESSEGKDQYDFMNRGRNSGLAHAKNVIGRNLTGGQTRTFQDLFKKKMLANHPAKSSFFFDDADFDATEDEHNSLYNEILIEMGLAKGSE